MGVDCAGFVGCLLRRRLRRRDCSGGGRAAEALQFGLSLLVWGVFVRTVLAWHITWAVNSVTHVWGYRNYDTGDNSRNNVFVGFSAMAKAGTTTTTPIRARPPRPQMVGIRRDLDHDTVARRAWPCPQRGGAVAARARLASGAPCATRNSQAQWCGTHRLPQGMARYGRRLCPVTASR